MKALVLSGGYGTRLRPLTYSQQKQLIPIANKPVLFHVLEDVIESGIKEIGIIVGPNKEQVIERVRSKDWDAKIEFIHQEKPLGLAHTIKISEDFLNNDLFVMYLGDNILRDGIVEYVNDFQNSEYDASILLTHVKNPEKFGCAVLNNKGEITKILEKPKTPPSDLAVVGLWCFKPIIFKAVKSIKPSDRGELEITDAVQWLIDNGYRIKSHIVSGWWKDTGKPEDILHANRLILDEIQTDVKGSVDSDAEIRGRVIIGEGTKIKERSIIKGPVIIGNNCLIKNSYIGPYTSVGNGCEIVNSEVEDSVIMENAQIHDIKDLMDSLIGVGVKIKKSPEIPKKSRFFVGDESELEL